MKVVGNETPEGSPLGSHRADFLPVRKYTPECLFDIVRGIQAYGGRIQTSLRTAPEIDHFHLMSFGHKVFLQSICLQDRAVIQGGVKCQYPDSHYLDFMRFFNIQSAVSK